jgi:hypothetical protein
MIDSKTRLPQRSFHPFIVPNYAVSFAFATKIRIVNDGFPRWVGSTFRVHNEVRVSKFGVAYEEAAELR